MKILWSALLHRATIINLKGNNTAAVPSTCWSSSYIRASIRWSPATATSA